MKYLKAFFPPIAIFILLSTTVFQAFGGPIRKNKLKGLLCVSVPVVMTSKESDFLHRENDTLSLIVEQCVRNRLDKAGFSWVRASEDLDDRIMRNFKKALMDDDDPVETISYAAAELAGTQNAKGIVVVYMYYDSNHRAAMMAGSIAGQVLGGFPGSYAPNAIAEKDDDLYLYCSYYDVQSRESITSERISISDKGKTGWEAFRQEVQGFVEGVFRSQ